MGAGSVERQPQGGELRAAPTHEAAYSGGGCVRVAGSARGCQRVALFRTAIALPPAGLAVGFTEAVCSGAVQTALALTLAAGAGSGSEQRAARAGAVCVLLPGAAAGSAALTERLPVAALAAGGSHEVVFVPPAQQGGSEERLALTSRAALAPPRRPQPEQPPEQGQAQQELRPLPWARRCYRVRPGSLPARPPGSCEWRVTSVDLLVAAAGEEGGAAQGSCEACLYLGES